MKNILIREVPKDVAYIIEEFKTEHSIKTNTEAVMRIIREFPDFRALANDQQAQYRKLNQEYIRLHDTVKNYTDNLDALDSSKAFLQHIVTK